MVLSSLNIHRLNVSRMTQVFFPAENLLALQLSDRAPDFLPVQYFSSVVFRQIAPEELSFSGFNFSRFLAVANFANINSNEQFFPVGYICGKLYGTSLKLRCISVSCSESDLSYEASLHFSASEKQSIPMSLSAKKFLFRVICFQTQGRQILRSLKQCSYCITCYMIDSFSPNNFLSIVSQFSRHNHNRQLFVMSKVAHLIKHGTQLSIHGLY